MGLTKPVVTVVIPNFNGESLLEKNLPHVLAAKKNTKNQILEVVVVDDGSTDKSVELIKKNFPEIRIIRHTKNRGFSAAVNTGVRIAKGKLILLINSDVVPAVKLLENVIENFDDKNVFAVSLHEKGSGSSRGTFSEGYIQIPKGKEYDKISTCFYVSGGSGIFRRSIWVELGGMDEKLLSPFYWEDIDLSYRAAKRGYKLLWDPRSLVEHNHETTISKIPKKYVTQIMERNRLLVIWKNITSKSLFRKHIAGLTTRSLRHPGYLIIFFMALSHLKTVLKARKKEIKESKVSDEVIFSRFS